MAQSFLLKIIAVVSIGCCICVSVAARTQDGNTPSPNSDVPPKSSFAVPEPNACRSAYDDFYASEPGVYAYWALCESGPKLILRDYVGPFDFDLAHSFWQRGVITGDAQGPVSDHETAVQISDSQPATAVAQNLPINRNAGTLAAWVNSKTLPPGGATAVPFSLSALHAHSSVSITLRSKDGKVCIGAGWQNSSSPRFGTFGDGNIWAPMAKCGFEPDTWHRVVLTWAGESFVIYIDGVQISNSRCGGSLDHAGFLYQLFTLPSHTAMSVAKVLVSNSAWSTAQVNEDYSPRLPKVQPGGVTVLNKQLGIIHRDVLGFADDNSDLSSHALVSSLLSGMRHAGVTSIRYAGGPGGIAADLVNWRGGESCTPKRGVTAQASNEATANVLDNYIPNIVQPLGLHIGYTVNYGTNPPKCDSGGDPEANGAALVDYSNNKKHYGIRYWEIGNEVYSRQSEPDFHSEPNTGRSYSQNEPAFYKAMKAKDPSIQVGVPVAGGVYDWLTFTLSTLSDASYDAVIWHNYPVHDAVTDGSTLYPERLASNTGRTRGQLLSLQTLLLNVGKKPDSIWVTEWNGDANGGGKWSKQSMGAVMPLFATMQLAEYMRAGIQYATWWTQGKAPACSHYYYDWTGETAYNWWPCGGLQLVYVGAVQGETPVGLKPGDLTPTAHAFQILSESHFVTEGEHMLDTRTDGENAPWLVSYAATHAGSYAVILINRDRDKTHTVPVAIEGRNSGAKVSQWTYGRAQYDQSRQGNWSVDPTFAENGPWSGTFKAVLPAWSVNVFVF